MVLFIVILIVVGFIGRVIYHRLVKMRDQIAMNFFRVETQLKKRYNLIPDLIEVASGYMDHEESALSKLAELHAIPFRELSQEQKIELDSILCKLTGDIRATAKSLPEPQRTEKVMRLQHTFDETETLIASARHRYTDSVEHYNNYLRFFPVYIISGMIDDRCFNAFDRKEDRYEASAFTIIFF